MEAHNWYNVGSWLSSGDDFKKYQARHTLSQGLFDHPTLIISKVGIYLTSHQARIWHKVVL